MNQGIGTIVERYRKEQGNGKPLSYRVFAEMLMRDIKDLSISHQTVAYWESGEREPSMDTLMALMLKTNDWRRNFASDLINIKMGQMK